MVQVTDLTPHHHPLPHHRHLSTNLLYLCMVLKNLKLTFFIFELVILPPPSLPSYTLVYFCPSSCFHLCMVPEVGETSFSDTDAETETRGSNFSRPGMILRPRKLKFRFRVWYWDLWPILILRLILSMFGIMRLETRWDQHMHIWPLSGLKGHSKGQMNSKPISCGGSFKSPEHVNKCLWFKL